MTGFPGTCSRLDRSNTGSSDLCNNRVWPEAGLVHRPETQGWMSASTLPMSVLCIVGTRPEVIKMAPVVLALRRVGQRDVRVLATAQHREMLDQMLRMFGIVPDLDLDAMRPDQTLAALTARLLTGLDACLARYRPSLVLAQGDTTTVMTAALASFYRKIPFGHVEAGLRTHDFDRPWPEEMNRVVAGRLAVLNFAPTAAARDNLLREGVPAERIHVTGNTVIDALHMMAERDFPLGVCAAENDATIG